MFFSIQTRQTVSSILQEAQQAFQELHDALVDCHVEEVVEDLAAVVDAFTPSGLIGYFLSFSHILSMVLILISQLELAIKLLSHGSEIVGGALQFINNISIPNYCEAGEGIGQIVQALA